MAQKHPPHVNGIPRPDPPRQRYDSVRVIASREGVVIKDARGGSMSSIGVDIALRPNMPPLVILRLLSGAFDVDGAPQFLVQDPASGQPKAAKRVEWHDGTFADFPAPPAPAAASPGAQPPDASAGEPATDPATSEAASPAAGPSDAAAG